MKLALTQVERNELLRNINSYQKLVNVLLENKNVDGVCRISQSELAQKLEISPTSISVKLRRLQKVDNCIEKVGCGGAYIVNYSNLLEKGPFNKVITFYDEVTQNPEIMVLSYKEQAEYLQFTLYEVQMVWGYLHGAFGSPRKWRMSEIICDIPCISSCPGPGLLD